MILSLFWPSRSVHWRPSSQWNSSLHFSASIKLNYTAFLIKNLTTNVQKSGGGLYIINESYLEPAYLDPIRLDMHDGQVSQMRSGFAQDSLSEVYISSYRSQVCSSWTPKGLAPVQQTKVVVLSPFTSQCLSPAPSSSPLWFVSLSLPLHLSGVYTDSAAPPSKFVV